MFEDLFSRLKRQFTGRNARDIDSLIERIGARHTPEDRRLAYTLFLQNMLYAPVVSMTPNAADKSGRRKKAAKKAAKKKKTAAKKKAAASQSQARQQNPGGESVNHHMNLAMAGVNGFQMFLMYTSDEDTRLADRGEHRLELPGRRAFEMSLKTEGVDGLLIHNKRNSWMALPNELVRKILEVFPEDP